MDFWRFLGMAVGVILVILLLLWLFGAFRSDAAMILFP
jgi:hypothetical protein